MRHIERRDPGRIPVAILGAGLTGMSAALTLTRSGVTHRVFERLAKVGGHAITVEEGGYRFDRTGHLLHLRDAEMRKEVEALLAGEVLCIRRRSVIWSNGVYTQYPFQANTLGLPSDVAYECLLGFVRANMRQSAAQPAPENFEEYCLLHFGAGFSRHFMLPYNSRLWGVSPREITAAWCERFVPRPTLEDVLAGAVGRRTAPLGYNADFLYPPLGIGTLSDALHRALPQIELGRAPRAIDAGAHLVEFEGEQVAYDALISTLPLPVLVGLVRDAPVEVTDAASTLRHTHLYYLDVALDEPCGQPHHWIYVPEARYPFYRVGCYSNFSAAMAPEGKACLYVELASRSAPDLELLLPEVASGLTEMGVISSPRAIHFARVRRIDPAYVIFDNNYERALSVILPFLEQAGIVSTGRYGAWNYSSMEDALLFGRRAAERLLATPP